MKKIFLFFLVFVIFFFFSPLGGETKNEIEMIPCFPGHFCVPMDSGISPILIFSTEYNKGGNS